MTWVPPRRAMTRARLKRGASASRSASDGWAPVSGTAWVWIHAMTAGQEGGAGCSWASAGGRAREGDRGDQRLPDNSGTRHRGASAGERANVGRRWRGFCWRERRRTCKVTVYGMTRSGWRARGGREAGRVRDDSSVWIGRRRSPIPRKPSPNDDDERRQVTVYGSRRRLERFRRV